MKIVISSQKVATSSEHSNRIPAEAELINGKVLQFASNQAIVNGFIKI